MPFKGRPVILSLMARAPSTEVPMGDKSPKAKQRDQKQKAGAEAQGAAKAKAKQESHSHVKPSVKGGK